MEKYLGVKIVQAEPMSKQVEQSNNETINTEHGIIIPANSCSVEGYKVVYENGYVSWSPKDVFEKAYKSAESFTEYVNIHVNTNTGEWDIPAGLGVFDAMNRHVEDSSDQELKKFCVEQVLKLPEVTLSSAVEVAQSVYDWIKSRS